MGMRRIMGWVVALAAAAATTPAQDVVVDDSDGAPVYTETGTWLTTAQVGAGYNGGLYRHTNTTRGPSTATWRPNLPTGGAWEVFAIFRRSGDRTARAPYTVTHSSGATVRELDQTGSFSGDLAFESLGTYFFEAGTAGAVTLSNNGGTGAYIADAVLWRPNAPPTIESVRRAPLYPTAADTVRLSAAVTDPSGIAAVTVAWSVEGTAQAGVVNALDDGTAGDLVAGDGVYTALLPPAEDGREVVYSFTARDAFGAETTGGSGRYTVGAPGDFRVVINEIVASNGGSARDPDLGASADWVELHNFGPDIADLSGVGLSDAPTNPVKWTFPDGASIPPGGYLIVWCDEVNAALGDYHTNFRLTADGESLVLHDPRRQQTLDEVTFPPLATDEAWARFPNATGDFTRTVVTTPLDENLVGVRGAAPTFSAPGGVFRTAFTLEITAPGASEIRYTLDGSAPGPTSTVYTAPITISATRGVRARAYYPDLNPSRIASVSYLAAGPTDRAIPVLNIVTDPKGLFDPATGIYTNFNQRGENWEREAHVSITSPDGLVSQSIDAGLRIHGGFSRTAAKKSLRLYFRNSYGASSWALPWLARTGVPEQRQLVLRAGGNDAFLVTNATQLAEVTYIRDQLMRDWYAGQGHYAADGFFVALHINGEYWGLYNATERITNDQMGAVHGGGSDWDIIKGTWTFATKFYTEATDGDLVAWNEFLAWHAANDILEPDNWAQLNQRLDLRNFVDFFALNIYCQNRDWPHNNWIASRHRTRTDARWTFHEWDSEWGLGLQTPGWTNDTLRWAQGENFQLTPSHNNTLAQLSGLFNGNDLDPRRTRDFSGVLDHPEGRRAFIESMEDLLNFEVATDKAIADFDRYADLIRTEIPREANRWAGSSSQPAATLISNWTAASERLRDFLRSRPAFMRGLVATNLGLAGQRTVTFVADGEGTGRLQVRGRVVDLPWTGTFFDASMVGLAARPDAGSRFVGWDGAVTGSSPEAVYTATAGPNVEVRLQFASGIATGPAPNDVIFNEYWVNDNGTFYGSVGAAISRDWFELLVVRDGVDLRGWRVTSNPTLTTMGAVGSGSLVFPPIDALAGVRAGTIILVVPSINDINTASFPEDDLDGSDFRLILYAGNGNIDMTLDPDFGIGNGDDALVLLAPGATDSFADDIGIDFIAEGTRITPASFFGVTPAPVVFTPAFAGIGDDDGAVFTQAPDGSFNNDNGADPDRTDFIAGPGGWIVDPPATFTGDSTPVVENRLTPGAPNPGQDLSRLRGGVGPDGWMIR